MLSELWSKVEELREQLTADGYSGHDGQVRKLIVQCRASLRRGTGELGPWEAWQLDFAERAIDARFLRLALVAVQNALAVSQLGAEEYDYGIRQAGTEWSSLRGPHDSSTQAGRGEDPSVAELQAAKSIGRSG